jgi:hypothetical protein
LIKARRRLISAIGTALTEGADPVTATRIWFEDRIGSAAAVEAAHAEQPAEVALTEEEPGFLERLSELEDAVPSLTQTLQLAASILNGITEVFQDGTTESMLATNAKEKLVVADRICEKLETFATRLSIAASDITSDVDRFGTGLEVLKNQWGNTEANARADFDQAIISLSDAALSSIPGAQGFRDVLRSNEYATRRMKLVYERIAQSVQSIIEASERIGRWKQLLTES